MSSSISKSSCQIPSSPSHVSAIPDHNLKRKYSSYLLSSLHESNEDTTTLNDPYSQARRKKSSTTSDRGSQTVSLLSSEDLSNYSGRGRSPYKTPVTAVLDDIKGNARLLESFEREISSHQSQLRDLVYSKSRYLANLRDDISQASTSEMSHSAKTPFLKASSNRAQSRSPSPDKYLSFLRNANPPIDPTKPEEVPENLPSSISYVVSQLAVDLDDWCVPSICKDIVSKNRLVPLRDTVFADMSDRHADSVDALATKAKKILTAASECQTYSKDENAWSAEVVKPTLKWEIGGEEKSKSHGPQCFSRVELIQTQSINKYCRQTYGKKQLKSKKVDFGLFLNKDHTKVQTKYDQVFESFRGAPALSPFENLFTRRLIPYLMVEVKPPSGNETESKAQLFTMLGAVVIKMRRLLATTPGSNDVELYPCLGFTVVGQHWSLYIAFGMGNKASDKIHVLGPINECSSSTDNAHGVFKLLRLQERIKNWARTSFWPWYCGAILDPRMGKASLPLALGDLDEDDDEDVEME